MTLPLDPDRTLALAYVPAAKRPAVEALWWLDAALGGVLAKASEPMITRIRLAWWREALERLDREPPPPEPLLQSLAAYVLPLGLSGAELSMLEDGWEAVAGANAPDGGDLSRYAKQRGGQLFRLTARLLGDNDFAPEEAGVRWALVDLARHSANPAEVGVAITMARENMASTGWPKALRPLGMLDVLSLSDLNKSKLGTPGSPYRVLRMIFHRITGH